MLFGDGGEDFDDFGVELRAGAAANFFAGVGHRQSAAVGAVTDHGVERVGDRENAGAEGNLVAFQAARIAGAVVELLVSKDDFRRIAEKRDADEHVVADFAVLAHDLLFVIGQRAWFAENAVGDSHFADIMKEGGARENGQVRGGNGHGFSDRNGESGDALTMAFGLGVLQVEGAAEGFESVVVGLLKLAQCASKLRGAFFDLVFELELVAAVFRDQAAMLKSAANAEEELVFFKGLEDVVIGTPADGFQCGGDIVDGGDHDHRDFGVIFSEPIEQFDAVHFRHDHVAQDEIRRGAFNLLLSSAAIAHGRTAIAF